MDGKFKKEGIIKSAAAEKQYLEFQSKILNLLQDESTVSLIQESNCKKSYESVNTTTTEERSSKNLIDSFSGSILDKKITELKKKWASGQSSTGKEQPMSQYSQSKKKRLRKSFIRMNRNCAKLSKPQYYVHKYKKLYRGLQKQIVKKVAHMLLKYDFKTFKEEKKIFNLDILKSFNRSNGNQRSFHKSSLMSTLRHRSSEVKHSSINFSLTKNPLDGNQLPENGSFPPLAAHKGLWVLPEQSKENSVYEVDEQQRQKKVALWLSERLNGLVKKKELEQELAKKNNQTKKTFIRYYGDSRREQLMKYYLRKPGKGTYKSDLSKFTNGENSDKLMIQLADGSVTVHYPKSENVAIVASPAVADPHQLHVNCFDRDQHRTCLATFSPNGKSCCYRNNGSLGLLLNEEGGMIKQDPYDVTNEIVSEGKEDTKSWLWPVNNNQMLDKPLVYRLNKEMQLKISGKHDILLLFTCERECVKIQIGYHTKLKQEHKSSEKQAKLKRKIPSAIKKPGRKSKFEEIKKELKFGSVVKKKFELDQPSLDELAVMRGQARKVVDKWMDFYRDTFGISSPHLKNITSTPKIRSPFRRVNSAKIFKKYKIINDREDVSKQLQSYRCPSAPISQTAKVLQAEFLYPEYSESTLSQVEKDKKTKTKKSKRKSTTKVDEDCKKSLEYVFASIHKSESRHKGQWMTLLSNQQMCPVSTRAEIENIVTNNKRMNCQHLLRCRCHKTRIPLIHDLEFDYFIQKVVPSHQLIIIYVTNSIYPKSCFYEEMFQQLHATANKNRAIPCLQSYKDEYRLFIYDISTANQTANRRSPLLLDRHNVVPGMTMMYKDKRLVFANNIFNGYGTAQSDFIKQVQICKNDKNFLPDDFRFQPSRGKPGFRTHWGGEMGGAGVDERGNPGIFMGSTVSQLRRSRTNWLVASLPPILSSIVASPKDGCANCDVTSVSDISSKHLASKSKSAKNLNISPSIISMYSSMNSVCEDEKRNQIYLKPI